MFHSIKGHDTILSKRPPHSSSLELFPLLWNMRSTSKASRAELRQTTQAGKQLRLFLFSCFPNRKGLSLQSRDPFCSKILPTTARQEGVQLAGRKWFQSTPSLWVGLLSVGFNSNTPSPPFPVPITGRFDPVSTAVHRMPVSRFHYIRQTKLPVMAVLGYAGPRSTSVERVQLLWAVPKVVSL